MQKILVDTNVLLRYLVDGDTLLEKIADKGVVWLVEEVVIELVFALQEHYGQSREKIFGWVGDLLIYRDQTNLSIVDAYLFALSEENKVELVTYDKKLKRKLIKQ